MSSWALLAWWPYQHTPMPPLDAALDAAPFLAWVNVIAEAHKYTSRGRTVRILVPRTDALKIPTGNWDMTGIVICPVDGVS